MARQNINIGTFANDASGDTLRVAGQKINETLIELYLAFGGDSNTATSRVRMTDDGIEFEGSSPDDFETLLNVVNPTADRTVLIPDASGTLVFDTLAQTITNKTLSAPVLIAPTFKDSASETFSVALKVMTGMAKNINVNLPEMTDSDTLVTLTSLATLTNKTLTAPTITNPTINNTLLDANGNEAVLITATGSAVNHINLQNAATGVGPTMAAVGDDSDVDLTLASKNGGKVRINSGIRYGPQTLTSSGAISTKVPAVFLNSATAIAMTLADGENGQMIHFVNINDGAATITPSTFIAGTSFTLNKYGAVSAIFNTSSAGGADPGWFLMTESLWDSSDGYNIFVTA